MLKSQVHFSKSSEVGKQRVGSYAMKPVRRLAKTPQSGRAINISDTRIATKLQQRIHWCHVRSAVGDGTKKRRRTENLDRSSSAWSVKLEEEWDQNPCSTYSRHWRSNGKGWFDWIIDCIVNRGKAYPIQFLSVNKSKTLQKWKDGRPTKHQQGCDSLCNRRCQPAEQALQSDLQSQWPTEHCLRWLFKSGERGRPLNKEILQRQTLQVNILRAWSMYYANGRGDSCDSHSDNKVTDSLNTSIESNFWRALSSNSRI